MTERAAGGFSSIGFAAALNGQLRLGLGVSVARRSWKRAGVPTFHSAHSERWRGSHSGISRAYRVHSFPERNAHTSECFHAFAQSPAHQGDMVYGTEWCGVRIIRKQTDQIPSWLSGRVMSKTERLSCANQRKMRRGQLPFLDVEAGKLAEKGAIIVDTGNIQNSLILQYVSSNNCKRIHSRLDQLKMLVLTSEFVRYYGEPEPDVRVCVGMALFFLRSLVLGSDWWLSGFGGMPLAES